MPNPKSDIMRWVGKPDIEITYQSAVKDFGGQVAALMDKLQASEAQQAKKLKPNEFTWRLVYDRAPDPENITDPKAFANILASNSHTALKATGSKWIGIEDINVTPAKVMQLYETRARAICAQRLANNGDQQTSNIEPPNSSGTDLLVAYDSWTKENPGHDKRIAAIARLTLIKLVESVEE